MLNDKCDESINIAFCIVGNVSGWISSSIWFVVLFPQILKNYKNKSVKGISFIWALMNFMASFVNAFFVFHNNLPTFSYISALYMPILELIFLIQFGIYHNEDKKKKITVATYLSFFLAMLFIVFLLFSNIFIDYLMWTSIVLWSIESFPQIYLNFYYGSTMGLSRIGQVLVFIGKTTDILGNFLLIIPIQYRFLGFFSTSSSYFGICQFVYYYGINYENENSELKNCNTNYLKDEGINNREYESCIQHNISNKNDTEIYNNTVFSNDNQDLEKVEKSKSEIKSLQAQKISNKFMKKYKYILLLIISIFLTLTGLLFIWRVKNYYISISCIIVFYIVLIVIYNLGKRSRNKTL
jgi:hypothetical protein